MQGGTRWGLRGSLASGKIYTERGPSEDGGRGGDFYAQAVRDIHILSKYKAKKVSALNAVKMAARKVCMEKKGEMILF